MGQPLKPNDNFMGGVINFDETITFQGTVTLETDDKTMALSVMALRGFPEGMSMDKYPNQASCEAASPGIVDAQSRARGTMRYPCTVTIDASGSRTIKLISK